MRVSLDWLAEFVALPAADALVERLSMGGFEDVFIDDRGPDLGEIRVGHVVSAERHPNADKLTVCGVDVGEGSQRSIVCGATNVAAGQKVAVALPGSRLPDGTKLKKSKLRGVVSDGMICSERELGLGDVHEGILVLDAAAPIGAPLTDVLPSEGRILEVGITPNRGDTASLLGLAREVHAFFGGELTFPEIAPAESGGTAADSIRVSIQANDACHQYVARVVRGVRVGPSPEWVKHKLEASGVRSINNVVDATNIVLLELGQPLHAFDLAKLAGAEIRVRRAAVGESMAFLDGVERNLDPADLVIADSERPVALAGVMGGAESEVGDGTTDVLIESANFAATSVRRSARRHGLHTEASYRFERGVDREGVARAADRVARLIVELAGGEVAAGRVGAHGDPPPTSGAIRLDVARLNRLLGTELSAAETSSLLARVGVGVEPASDGILTCRPPSHRNDLELPQDLSEEVARTFGYDRIPATLPVGELRPVALPRNLALAERARDALVACGLTESVTLPFVAAEDLEALGFATDDPRLRTVGVLNPIQERDGRLRSTILPSLLRVARQNLSRQVDRVRLFEICRVFWPRGEGELPDEPLFLAALLTLGQDRHLWDGGSEPPILYQAKGVAERLLSGLGYVASLPSGSSEPFLHPGAEAMIEVAGQRVGAVGELHPVVAKHFEITPTCALIELNLTALHAVKEREFHFQEVSKEPWIRRDLAVLVDRAQPAGEMLEAIRKSGGSDLISVELFDRYEGTGVPEGRVSLAFRLVFQRADRTLTDAEVAKASDRVIRMLARQFGGELR